MLVSHKKQFVFLKTFKTAGTSIEMYFEPYCVEPGQSVTEKRELVVSQYGVATARLSRSPKEGWWNHMPASEVRSMMGSDLFGRYFRFCTVRNPYDQLVSAFYFYKRSEDLRSKSPEEQIDLFRRWAAISTNHLPTHHFLLDGALCVDGVIRYERLTEDLEQVCRKLDVPFDPLRIPTTKAGYRTRSIPLAAYFDQRTKGVIEQWLDLHFNLFGYKPM